MKRMLRSTIVVMVVVFLFSGISVWNALARDSGRGGMRVSFLLLLGNAEKTDKQEVSFDWTDLDPKAGSATYYYVRGEQSDSELVWLSPMWITYAP